MARIISVEGNIGAGKSTLLKALADVPGVRVIAEPIEEWCRPALPGGSSMLEAYYADQPRNAMAFQMFAMLTRAQQLRGVVASGAGSGALVFTERNSWSDYELFGRPMHASGLLNDADWCAYTAWFEAITADGGGLLGLPKPSGIVYLRSTPGTCARRVAGRARAGEGSIDGPYLEMLDSAHARYIERQRGLGTEVFVLDADAHANDAGELAETSRRIVEWAAGLAAV